MTTRTLALRRETLTELTTGDLVRVAGAQDSLAACLVAHSFQNTCRVCLPTGYCPTLFC